MTEPGVTVAAVAPPPLSPAALFWRFLRFGLHAWGGPVPQIAMLRHELVERERWVTPEKFNRVLAVYQALPGPEAHEMCCYFGYLARGRLGSVLAGLGFMLPGLVLMLLAAWLYVRFGMSSPWLAAVFAGMQCAVAAMIIRAVHKLGKGALTAPALWATAVLAALGQLLGVHFAIALFGGCLIGAVRRSRALVVLLLVAWAVLVAAAPALPAPSSAPQVADTTASAAPPTVSDLGLLGLKAGIVTFGGAYTAIPVVEREAIASPDGGWMTRQQFIDGLAIGGVLPAPLVIFTTFVGFLGAGLAGALAITAGMFLPAFSFTLIGHRFFEKLVENPRLHAALDGIMAAVVGIIAATALTITLSAIGSPDATRFLAAFDVNPAAVLLVALALAALYRVKHRLILPGVVLAAGLIGLAVLR